MEQHLIDTKQMDAMKVLSEITLKISEAKNTLVSLQEQETEYLISREKKAMDRIQAAFDASKVLLEETNKNYESINEFATTVTEGAKFLSAAQEAFSALRTSFETKQALWERDIKNQEETITGLRNLLKIDAVKIENDKKAIVSATKVLEVKTIKMNDERETLDRAIKRLKEGRI